jgi:hypothetical protein
VGVLWFCFREGGGYDTIITVLQLLQFEKKALSKFQFVQYKKINDGFRGSLREIKIQEETSLFYQTSGM